MRYAAVTFVVTLCGGLLPLLRAWSHRQLHGVLALATGVFLGTVFLHLLPHIGDAGGPGALDTRSAWLLTLGSTLAVYLLDALVFRSHDHDDVHRHRAVGYSALVGLSVHSLTEGVAFSVVAGASTITTALFLSILGHKLLDGFSLSSVIRLADFPRARVVAFVVGFALLTPLGMLLGSALVDELPRSAEPIVRALAAGTILFVSLCELLPEVFHHREDSSLKILLLLVGIGCSMALHEVDA